MQKNPVFAVRLCEEFIAKLFTYNFIKLHPHPTKFLKLYICCSLNVTSIKYLFATKK